MKFEQTDNGDIIVISKDENKKIIYPEVGKTYYAYDDGKVRPSRELKFKITKVLNLDNDKISKQLLNNMAYEIKECYWLYNSEQHLIFRGKALKDDGTYDNDVGYQWFALTKENEWFGIISKSWGFWDSLLDVDGSLYKIAHEYDEE